MGATIEDLVGFAEEHPTRRLDRQSTRWVIEHIGLAQDRLLDLADDEGRRLVASMFWGDNPDSAAELLVVGYRGGAGGPPALTQALCWAAAKAAEAGAKQLEVSLPAALAGAACAVTAQGYRLIYRLLTMQLDAIGDCRQLDLSPPGDLIWTALSEDNVDSAHECYRRAFAPISGAQVPDLVTFRTLMLQAEHRPRVLLAGRRAVAFARVVLLDETARHGEVRLIARHPQAPAAGLGKAALAEALRQLLRLGADSACLEVASDNERAIGLYRRFGFVTCEQTGVYRRALAGGGA